MKSKFIAGTSLTVMAAGFVATLFMPGSTAQLILQGGFEAGLVGGIADWFAVTALFRHPLGLPIPHTSLLLKNKDRIVQSLVSSMENELLNKASITNKLRGWRILRMATMGLAKLLRRRRNRVAMLEAAAEFVRGFKTEKAVPVVQKLLAGFARDMNVKPVAESALAYALQERMDEKALDFALDKAADWAGKPETAYRLGQMAGEKLSAVNVRGFMGFAVQAISGFMSEEKLGAILPGMLTSAIHDLRQPHNGYRGMIVRELREQLHKLASDDEKLTRLNKGLSGAIQGEVGGRMIAELLDNARAAIVSWLEEEQESGGKAVFSGYRAIVRAASGNAEAVARWEDRLLGFVVHMVESNHYRIGALVKENVDRMDDREPVS
ncbi:MAG: DUF445 domain-containing protein, partial [Cohnella sp.]|nr:DUF445 domain-containing protein [Cohnella sp.]